MGKNLGSKYEHTDEVITATSNSVLVLHEVLHSMFAYVVSFTISSSHYQHEVSAAGAVLVIRNLKRKE